MHQFKKLQREQQTQRQQESRLALKNLFKAAHDWGLDRRNTLSLAGISSLHQIGHWSSAADDILLTDDQMEVVSYLLTIHGALALKNPRPKDMESWLKTDQPVHSALNGKSPLRYMQEHPSKLMAAKTLSHLICNDY
jgi:hypothetical protein